MLNMRHSLCRRFLVTGIFLAVGTSVAYAKITTPKQFFGFDVCDDYQLANYQQLSAYWQKLASESNRVKLVSIGKTEEGRDQWMLLISDPNNIRNAEKIRQTAERISKAKDFKDFNEFQSVAKSAKSVVWIDGGLHANETLGAQQLIETAYQLVSRNDEENKRILKDTMILLVHANPDGMDLVSNWYMRKKNPSERSLANIPELYEKYAGHDNNRDFFQMNLAETRNMNKILYRTWFPQIMYNHHQSAPSGTIMFCPPFRNPFNYHVDPLVNNATDLVGTHIIHRLTGQNLGGVVSRDAASFNAWWNGGLRTTTYFHNMVGILTETWGSPNPTMVPFVPERQIPSTDLPKPVDVRLWHLKDSLRYEVEANYAILDYASRYRERVLLSVYQAATNSIERGSKDNWTRYPSRIKELGEASLKNDSLKDARYYTVDLSANTDQHSARTFLNLLINSGIDVYNSGSKYIIPCNQAYRPHILDMFEAQDYPNDFQYPGGPPKPPYDSAGYTPAYTMGVKFERHFDTANLSGANGPIAPIQQPIAELKARTKLFWNDNETYKQLNLAVKNGMKAQLVRDGVVIYPASQTPSEATQWYSPKRVALLDRFGGNMPSGWMRWLFDNWNFDYTVIFPPQIDKGSLKANFDVIVIPDSLVSRTLGRQGSGGANSGSSNENPIDTDPTVPEKYKGRFGAVNEQTISSLRKFVEEGGRVVAIGSSSWGIAGQFKLPISNYMIDPSTQKAYSNTQFYVPASVLRVKIESDPMTLGVSEYLDTIFDDSPVFSINQTDAEKIKVLARFDSDKPLKSGWAWGQEKLKGGVAMASVKLGKGDVVLYGPEVNFRGQNHASFKLIFNAIIQD